MSCYEPWRTFVTEVSAAGEVTICTASSGKKVVVTGLAVYGQGFNKWEIRTGEVVLLVWKGGIPLVLPINDPLYGGTGWLVTGEKGDLKLKTEGSGSLTALVLYREMEASVGV